MATNVPKITEIVDILTPKVTRLLEYAQGKRHKDITALGQQ